MHEKLVLCVLGMIGGR